MMKFESPFAFDGQVDVSDVIGSRNEANDPGDEKDQTLEPLKTRDAVGNYTANNQAWKSRIIESHIFASMFFSRGCHLI